MQTLSIYDSPELLSAKNTMQRSLIAMVVCYFLSVVPFIGMLAVLVMIGAAIWYYVGVYRFSKLTNSTLFKTFMLIILFYFSTLLVIVAAGIIAGTTGDVMTSLYLIVIISISNVIAIYWLLWKVAKEFSERTNLKHFVLSYKFQIGSTILVMIGLILLLSPLFGNLDQLSVLMTDEPALQTFIAQSMLESSLVMPALLIIALALITSLTAFIFWLLGHIKITEVSVREKTQPQASA